MAFFTALSSITIMGVMILIGILLRRKQPLTPEVRHLMIQLIVNVGMPSIVLSGILNFPIDGSIMALIFQTFLIAMGINIGAILLSYSLAKAQGKSGAEASEIAIVSSLGNTAFIGIPLCTILFGPKGTLLAAVFDAGLDFVLWSVAVFLLQKSSRFSLINLKAMLNIPMLAIILGLTLGFLQFEAPQLLKDLTRTLAGIASPLAMIYIGFLIPDMWKRLPALSLRRLAPPITFKLLFLPLATMGIILFIPALDGMLKNVLIVQMAMPTFTLASVLFERYDADVNFGIAVTTLSILLSIITIPLMIYIAGI